MIQSFFTKEQSWLDRWDEYLQTTERGLYNQLSDWIKSYEVYGFDYDFYLITENDKIVGGCGVVLAKFTFFKFLILPCGPVLSKGFENQLDTTVLALQRYAKQNNCCYLQMNLPLLEVGNSFHDYCWESLSSQSLFFSGKIGTKFKYVIPLFGMRLVDLFEKTKEDVIKNYSSNHKRNIKKATNLDFEFRYIDSPQEIEQAYQCFVLNSQQKGYPIRAFESIKQALFDYVKKDFAQIGCCYYQGKMAGAIYVIRCGQRLTYINGGVLKEFQDLPVSVFMHTQIIEDSLAKGYKSYDVSVGGSAGVVRFKEGFGSQLYTYQNSRYWILKPTQFSVYLFFEKHLKSHKQTIAKVLFYLKKWFK